MTIPEFASLMELAVSLKRLELSPSDVVALETYSEGLDGSESEMERDRR